MVAKFYVFAQSARVGTERTAKQKCAPGRVSGNSGCPCLRSVAEQLGAERLAAERREAPREPKAPRRVKRDRRERVRRGCEAVQARAMPKERSGLAWALLALRSTRAAKRSGGVGGARAQTKERAARVKPEALFYLRRNGANKKGREG